MQVQLFETEAAIESQVLSVVPKNFPQFQIIAFMWYQDLVKKYYVECPNLTDLLQSEDQNAYESYFHMLCDVVADSICIQEGWDDGPHLEVAYEIISNRYEWFVARMRKDLKLIFDSHQMFYAENYKTEVVGQYVEFNHDVYHHSPLQEVW